MWVIIYFYRAASMVSYQHYICCWILDQYLIIHTSAFSQLKLNVNSPDIFLFLIAMMIWRIHQGWGATKGNLYNSQRRVSNSQLRIKTLLLKLNDRNCKILTRNLELLARNCELLTNISDAIL